jgi:NAD(P)-dependent dehydrogenase (short-subunit alcohol dehydrogenase family)
MSSGAAAQAASYAGKVVIVTGGASGIGRATAMTLADAGASVVVADKNEETLATVSKELATLAPEHRWMASSLDVADPEQPVALAAAVVERFGRIDLLVNSAGIVSKSTLADMPVDMWDAMMTVNARGPFLCLQAVAKHMVAGGGGAIVNLSSIASELGNPLAVHYAAAKGAVRMLTRASAVALAPDGVRVNAVAPGITSTPLTEDRLKAPDVLAATLDRIPMGRLGATDDVVGAILFLGSDSARYVTGQTLIVDGGWSAQLYGASYAEMQMAQL